jgi:hypothetical protein
MTADSHSVSHSGPVGRSVLSLRSKKKTWSGWREPTASSSRKRGTALTEAFSPHFVGAFG